MQTLISAFDDRDAARRAVERLVRAGFARADVHLQEAPGPAPQAHDPADRALGERTMQSAEREVAVDRGVFESIGHFFVSIFGMDDAERHADRYTGIVRGGHSVVAVDAKDDGEAETAAIILHDMGAVDVNDHGQAAQQRELELGEEDAGDRANEARRVQLVDRGEQPRLRDIIGDRRALIENDVDQRQGELARSAGRVTLDRHRERAVAANDPVNRDRPNSDD